MQNYVKDYEQFRYFLRFFALGCYHKTYITKVTGQSARSYEEYWGMVKDFLPAEIQNETTYGTLRHHSLQGDYFYGGQNYLAKTYNTLSIPQKKLTGYITIIDILNASDEPLLTNKLWNLILDKFINKNDSTIERNTVNSYLRELVSKGVLTSVNIDRKSKVYSLTEHPLQKLTTAELLELHTALSFYKNISLLQIPGYYLQENIEKLLIKQDNSSDYNTDRFFQLKNTSFNHILDDAVRREIIHCIEHQHAVSFLYKGKEKEALPQAIITDYYTNHQYLLALIRQKPNTDNFTILNYFRLEHISHIEPTIMAVNNHTSKRNFKKITLAFYYDSIEEKQELRKRISACQNYAQTINITDGEDNSILCTMEITDQIRLVPWITTFIPKVKVIAGNALQKRLSSNVSNVVKAYTEADYAPSINPNKNNSVLMEKVKKSSTIKSALAAVEPLSEFHSRLFMDNTTVPIFDEVEFRYLKSFLLDDDFAFLVSQPLREKLMNGLTSIKALPLKENELIIRHKPVKITAIEKEKVLYPFIQAVTKGSMVEINHKIYTPMRLEYDAAYDYYYLILLDSEQKEQQELHLSWLAIADVDYINVLSQRTDLNRTAIFHKLLAKEQRSLTLKLFPVYNGVDRCFSMFSSYNKKSFYDEKSESYTLEIFFKDSEYEEIINKIISLGPAVKVIAPETIADKVKQRFVDYTEVLNQSTGLKI